MSSPYTGDDPFVYISYVREDHSLVVDDIDRLVDLGIRCYWTTDDEADVDRLKAASFFIALVSDNTEDSEGLLQEAGMALRESKDSACLHLADVPLGGKAELLLKGITDVKKYRMSDALYMRWLANSLPDPVKTRDIPIPKEEPKPAAAPKPKGGGGVNGPPLAERLKEVDPKVWGIVGVFSLLCVVALVAMSMSSGPTERDTPDTKTAAKTGPAADPAAVAKAKAEADAREAERRKRLEATRRSEEAKWTLREKVRKGEDKFRSEDWDGAIKALSEGIEQKDLATEKLALDLAKARLLRGRAYEKKRQFKEAAEDFRSYLKVKDDDAEVWYDLGRMLQINDDFAGAIKAYDAVVKHQPKRALAWRYRGDCHRRLKKWAEALEDYTKNIEADPKDAAAYRYRARVKKKMGDDVGASDDMAKSSELINARRRGN